MNLAQLHTSRTLWRTRELLRYRAWQKQVHRRVQVAGDRARAFQLYKEAKAKRVLRDKQIAGWEITDLDESGVNLIIGEEGNLNYVYNDSQGHATVGVGHLLHLGNFTAADSAKWGTRAKPKYSKAEFVSFFRKDAEKWAALPLVGIQRLDGEPDLELRQCKCGSTLAIEVKETNS